MDEERGGSLLSASVLLWSMAQLVRSWLRLRIVAAEPGAVTAASMSMALPGLRAVAIDGVEPSAASVRSGTYLLGRPMYLVARAAASEAARKLLELALSDAGQAVVAKKFTPAR